MICFSIRSFFLIFDSNSCNRGVHNLSIAWICVGGFVYRTISADDRQQQIQRQQQDEQKRQQIGQQQYYLQQQERQRAEQVPQAQAPQNYDEYQQRRVVQQISSTQEQQLRQQGQEQYDPYRAAQQQQQQSQLDAYYEQQRRTAAATQQPSPPSGYQQDPYRPDVAGGQPYRQASPNQQQQQQQQQQQVISADQPTKPVGIKGLMNKFTGPTKVPTYESKSKVTRSFQQSNSSHTSSSGPGQTTTTSQSSKSYSMTYSALPKAQEPPVNSAAYFEMLQQSNPAYAAAEAPQAAAPPHIQGPAPGFGALRDRFKSGSVSENNTGSQEPRQGQAGNSSLSSLRDQFLNRATESTQGQEESFSQRIQTVSRSIVGEEPRPAKPVEEPPAQRQSVDEQAASSDGALADGGSSSGASSLDHDTVQTAAAEPEPTST